MLACRACRCSRTMRARCRLRWTQSPNWNSNHSDVQHLFLRELVGWKEISIVHVTSPFQYADFLTKAIPRRGGRLSSPQSWDELLVTNIGGENIGCSWVMYDKIWYFYLEFRVKCCMRKDSGVYWFGGRIVVVFAHWMMNDDIVILISAFSFTWSRRLGSIIFGGQILVVLGQV